MKGVTRLGLVLLPFAFGMWINHSATALDNKPMAKTYCYCGCKPGKDGGEYTTKKISLVAGADPETCKKYNDQACKSYGSSYVDGVLTECKFVADRKDVNPEKLNDLRKKHKAVPSTTVQ